MIFMSKLSRIESDLSKVRTSIADIQKYLTKLSSALDHNMDEIYTDLSLLTGKNYPVEIPKDE